MAAPLTSPLARRLKKHIIGRSHEFFAITAPTLEKLCKRELDVILPQNEAFVQQGGVTFYGKPEAMYLANLHLRSATRIIMRIGRFKAEKFVQFAKKMNGIAWELYLLGDVLPKIAVNVHHCRLYHSDALAEVAWDFFAALFPEANDDGNAPKIYIRGINDEFTLSMDTSGDSLYKRGLKTHGGEAPIRETLAYAILQRAGYKGGLLMDPMCGSGTFSLEAALLAGNIAPGLGRNFAFMHTPFFNAPQWAYLQKQARNVQKAMPAKYHILATDKDRQACIKLDDTVRANGLESLIQVQQRDFFTSSPKDCFGGKRGLVVLNPPYGMRLLNRAEAENLYGAICQKLNADYRHWQYALITPSKDWIDLPNPRFKKVWHGGLNLWLAKGRL